MALAGKRRRGQGTLEYAGALVIAVVVVSSALALAPSNLSTMYNKILGNVASSIVAKVPASPH